MSGRSVNGAGYEAGRAAGWLAAAEAEDGRVGEPVGVDEDTLLGWWNGVYEAQAWLAGWRACERGVHACLCDRDDEAAGWRALWLAGYAAALAVVEARHAA